MPNILFIQHVTMIKYVTNDYLKLAMENIITTKSEKQYNKDEKRIGGFEKKPKWLISQYVKGQLILSMQSTFCG